MCELCDDTYLKIDTLEVARAAFLLERANHYGALHVIVDDCNMDNGDLISGLRDPNTTQDEKALCGMLLQMDYDARVSALAMADHRWGVISIAEYRMAN